MRVLFWGIFDISVFLQICQRYPRLTFKKARRSKRWAFFISDLSSGIAFHTKQAL